MFLIWLAAKSRARDGVIVAKQLPVMVASGWVSPQQAYWLQSPQGRKDRLAREHNREARGVLRTIDGAPRHVWAVLPLVAPELGEWAEFFAALEPRRRVVAAGARGAVGEREADDLVRDARAFRDAAETAWERGGRPVRADGRGGSERSAVS